jgi:hypothetical protein
MPLTMPKSNCNVNRRDDLPRFKTANEARSQRGADPRDSLPTSRQLLWSAINPRRFSQPRVKEPARWKTWAGASRPLSTPDPSSPASSPGDPRQAVLQGRIGPTQLEPQASELLRFTMARHFRPARAARMRRTCPPSSSPL